jgi:hypothetical protein
VLLGKTYYAGRKGPAPGEQPHHNTIAFNVMQDYGAILKHVAGVGMRTARANLVSHNRFLRSPRYGIAMTSWVNADGSGWGQSDSNVLEYNILDLMALETNDVGAINFGGGASLLLSTLLAAAADLLVCLQEATRLSAAGI